jgi:hypothetical protein
MASAESICACADEAGRRGERLQVGIGRHEDHEIAGTAHAELGGGDVVLFRTVALDLAQVEDGLRHTHARVEHVERADEAWNAGWQWKAERREVDDLAGLADPSADVGEKRRESVGPVTRRVIHIVVGEDQPEIVLEPPVDGVQDRQLQRLRSERP